MDPQALVGAVFNGRFRLTRLLGEGGMGAVYEAQAAEGPRALKVLHAEFIHEKQIFDRFVTEARTAQSLQHPHIAKVYEQQVAEDGTPYLVMELLGGMPLGDLIAQEKPIAPAAAIPVIQGVLSALTLAHQRGVVHRDLKPDNLFLLTKPDGSYDVRVLDFGIAKVMDAAGGMGNKTRTGVLLGTPGYMSPEQIKNSKGVDPRSDLWSLGVIAYEMLTARDPFPADNDFAKLTVVLSDDVQPIEKVAPHLAHWATFFRRALARELDQRFQSADEMLQAVTALARTGSSQGGTQALHSSQLPNMQALSQAQPQASQAHVPQAHHQAAASRAAPVTAQSQAYPSHPPSAAHPQGAPRGGGVAPTSVLQASDLPPPAGPAAVASASAAPPAGRDQPSTHISAFRPPGTPTLPGGSSPPIEVVDAPPVSKGAPYWMVAAAGGVGIAIGFVAGFLAGG